jgi:NAD+ diphosphatase
MSDFVRAYPPAVAPSSPALLLPFVGDELALDDARLWRTETVPVRLAPPEDALFLGTLGGVPVRAYTVSRPADDDILPAFTTVGLRALYGVLDDDELALAGYGAQLLRWARTSRFCGACGGVTRADDGWSRRCVDCGHSVYPPVSPAVLCLVHDGGERVLLATKAGWGTRYSILAGFVEPGEGLEDCCRRETVEEVGVAVTDLVYQGSQPWPFPHQLMVGFTARYDGGEIVVDAQELADARWFPVDALPDLPPPFSLSRQIIDHWIAGRKEG